MNLTSSSARSKAMSFSFACCVEGSNPMARHTARCVCIIDFSHFKGREFQLFSSDRAELRAGSPPKRLAINRNN